MDSSMVVDMLGEWERSEALGRAGCVGGGKKTDVVGGEGRKGKAVRVGQYLGDRSPRLPQTALFGLKSQPTRDLMVLG